jgi:hypothetical protein
MTFRRALPLFLFCLCAPALARGAEPRPYAAGKYGHGELSYINGLPVLRVAGTPEEIGEQIGKLTAQPLTRLMEYPKHLVKALGISVALPVLVAVGNSMTPQFPPDHLKELNALAKSCGLDRDLGILGNTLPDLAKIGGCSTLYVGAERSTTGAPLLGRNLDYFTGGILQDYSLVIVYQPRGKHAFVSIGFPGLVGCLSGMNDAGLTLATLEVNSARDGAPHFDGRGVPYTLALRRVLEECTTVAQAEQLLRSLRRTTMNNLAICDLKDGAVFEMTPKSLVVRRSVAGLCACTNHFRTQELATATRCRRYDVLDQCRQLPLVSLAELAKKLDAANQGEGTLQTMIFEPTARRLHLAIGRPPSSRLPLRVLELAPFFAAAGLPEASAR